MNQDYNVYEYVTINVKNVLETMYIDLYKNFGWIHINNEKRDYYINVSSNPNTVEIKFKRDINIKNRDELQELQNKCEKAFLAVDKLEKQPESLATMCSLIIGIIAIFFIVISIFLIIKNTWFLAILCMAIGIVGCVFSYFIYKNIKYKKEIENKKKIEEEQKIISNICKQVRKILIENY